MIPGAPGADAPVRLPNGRNGWFLRQLGQGFTVLLATDAQHAGAGSELRRAGEGLASLAVLTVAAEGDADLVDCEGRLTQRYDLRPGTVVLLRPDHHVSARWRAPDAVALRQALKRALALA